MEMNLKKAQEMLAKNASVVAVMSAHISTIGCSMCANCSGIVGG